MLRGMRRGTVPLRTRRLRCCTRMEEPALRFRSGRHRSCSYGLRSARHRPLRRGHRPALRIPPPPGQLVGRPRLVPGSTSGGGRPGSAYRLRAELAGGMQRRYREYGPTLIGFRVAGGTSNAQGLGSGPGDSSAGARQHARRPTPSQLVGDGCIHKSHWSAADEESGARWFHPRHETCWPVLGCRSAWSDAGAGCSAVRSSGIRRRRRGRYLAWARSQPLVSRQGTSRAPCPGILDVPSAISGRSEAVSAAAGGPWTQASSGTVRRTQPFRD